MYDWPFRLSAAEAASPPAPPHPQRGFLVVIDGSEECEAAVRFAALRAARTKGLVTLLSVSSVPDFHHWMFVGSLMKEEQRLQAEERLSHFSALVEALSGQKPEIVIRDGDPQEELLRLLDQDRRLSVLVLAASGGPDGPGPLISAMTGKHAGHLRLPVTIVPGTLTPDQLDALT
ncbi:universal stress protein [Novispirillum itersonii]|uniref:universal stress protein n=1 Tax=Novispirillum itersonii TaxID=189 RepID=UPI00036638B7|nr:universal stress protein [Novispirillum itersonii]